MIDSHFRKPFQSLIINPIVAKLAKKRATPLMYTTASLLSGLAILPALAYHYFALSLVLLVISGFFDILDGSVARAKNQTTAFGAICDIVSDRLVEIAVILGLYFVEPEERGLLCLLMLGSAFFCVTTFLVVGIFQPNVGEKSFFYSPGIMERTEAFLLFAFMIAFPYFFNGIAIFFTVLVSLTAIIRIWESQKLIR